MSFQDEYDGARETLLDDGFKDIDGHGGLSVGTRVRGRGQQWTEAIRNGTGYIRAIMRKRGRWEQIYGRPNIELLIERDEPINDRYLMNIADYHAIIVVRGEAS